MLDVTPIAEPMDMNHTTASPTARDDYAHVRRAIEYLTENWRDHPSLEDIAASWVKK